MEEIAADAGLRKPSLYYYFPTKIELFRTVVETHFEELHTKIETILRSDESSSARIRQYVEARFECFRSLYRLNLSVLPTATRGSLAIKSIFQNQAQRELSWLRRLFDDGRERGEFMVESVGQTAEAFLHVLQGLRLRFIRAHLEDRPGVAAVSKSHREVLLVTRIFLAGVSRKRNPE